MFFVYLFLCLFVCLCLCLSLYLFVRLFVCPFVCLFLCLCACSVVRLSTRSPGADGQVPLCPRAGAGSGGTAHHPHPQDAADVVRPCSTADSAPPLQGGRAGVGGVGGCGRTEEGRVTNEVQTKGNGLTVSLTSMRVPMYLM